MYARALMCNRLGMRKKKPVTKPDVLASIQSTLSDRPELADRIYSILQITDEPLRGGRIRSADEVELMLVEELRKLGNESLVGWSGGVDQKLGKDLKAENPKAQIREKKLKMVEPFWSCMRKRVHLAQ